MEDPKLAIASLPSMSSRQLRATWRGLRCGAPLAPGSRDLLIREIAYKLQERAHDGLAPAVRRRLRTLVDKLEASGASPFAPAPLLKPGTRLLREWGGRTHTVIVLDTGFEYDGGRYGSLTKIARRIPGALGWGPLFLGLRKPAATPADATGAAHE